MKLKELLKKLEGMQTIDSVMAVLGVNKQKAGYYVYRLRKAGYVKTERASNNKRVYNISFQNKLGGVSYYDVINANSPIKVVSTENHTVHGRRLIPEEAIVYAVKTAKLRVILASLALFKKIHNWSRLYRLAKENNLEREIGALYDVTKSTIKVRKMNKRFKRNALPKRNSHFKEIIQGLKSKDFGNIEKTWKVFIPFNKADLEEYR